MAVGDVFRMVIHINAGTNQARPGLHFEHTLVNQTAAQLVTAWRSTVEPALVGALSSDYAIVGYEVHDRLPGTGATQFAPVSPSVPGTVVGEGLPPQDAVVFQFKSTLKSGRSRGRVYWPGASESHHQGGLLIGAGASAWVAVTSAITTNFIGASPPAGFRLVNFSPEQLQAPKPPPTFVPRPGTLVTPVSSIVLDTTIRTQRRRQIGRGQ